MLLGLTIGYRGLSLIVFSMLIMKNISVGAVVTNHWPGVNQNDDQEA